MNGQNYSLDTQQTLDDYFSLMNDKGIPTKAAVPRQKFTHQIIHNRMFLNDYE